MPRRARPFRKLRPEHFLCQMRAVGHSWENYDGTELKAPSFGERVSWRCVRGCGTTKHELLGWDGRRIATVRYIYEEGYKYAKPEDMDVGTFNAEMRAEFMVRKRTGELVIRTKVSYPSNVTPLRKRKGA